jgi:L-malate glycosyltransferase
MLASGPFMRVERSTVARAITIAHVAWLTEVGGGELFLLDLAAHVDAARFRQQVFCLGPGGPLLQRLVDRGHDVLRVPRTGRAGVLTLVRLAAALRRARPEVVQTHGEAGVFWGLPAARLARCPAVSALIYQNHRSAWHKMAALRLLLPRATAIVAGSVAVRQFVGEALGVAPERSLVLHCGIDPEPFRAAARARRDAGRRRGRPVVLAVGRLVREKGHDVLLRAFARICERRDAELWIVGDGPLRGALGDLAGALGIGGRVRFLATVHPTCSVLAEADIFAFPSLVEPQGLAVLEAFAAGVPVVASRTGGIAEMLEDGRDGVLVPPGEPEPLAAALAALLEDPGRGKELAAAAARRLGEFDIRAVARRYEGLWSSLAGGAGLHAPVAWTAGEGSA